MAKFAETYALQKAQPVVAQMNVDLVCKEFVDT